MGTFLPTRPIKKPAGPCTKARPAGDTADAPGGPLGGATSVVRGPVRGCGRVEGRMSGTDWNVGRAHLLLDQLMVTTRSARLYRLPVKLVLYFWKNTNTKYKTDKSVTCIPSSSTNTNTNTKYTTDKYATCTLSSS